MDEERQSGADASALLLWGAASAIPERHLTIALRENRKFALHERGSTSYPAVAVAGWRVHEGLVVAVGLALWARRRPTLAALFAGILWRDRADFPFTDQRNHPPRADCECSLLGHQFGHQTEHKSAQVATAQYA